MKTKTGNRRMVERMQGGMTLIEVVIATAGIGILMVTLYVAFSQGFAIVQAARENLRATQILQEKMETMRVYNWDQITGGVVPDRFVEPFYAVEQNGESGFNYRGVVTITNAPVVAGTDYAGDVRLVVVQVEWNSGSVVKRREMRTLVCQNGLQKYVY